MLPFPCHTGMVSVNNYNEFQSLECNCVKNVWHKLLPNTAVNAFGSLEDIPPGNQLYQISAHHPIMCIYLPSLFVVRHFLSGWDTTSFHTSTSAIAGTMVLDLQSSSCVHCQLFPTHSNGPAAQPFSAGVHNQPPETTPSGSQAWYKPAPAKLGQLAYTLKALPAQCFPEEIYYVEPQFLLLLLLFPSPPLSLQQFVKCAKCSKSAR